MKRRRRAAITIETDEFVVVRQFGGGQRRVARCPDCGRQMAMLSVDAAARVAGVSARTVYRWVEEDKVHFIETPAGQLLVCSESLKGRG